MTLLELYENGKLDELHERMIGRAPDTIDRYSIRDLIEIADLTDEPGIVITLDAILDLDAASAELAFNAVRLAGLQALTAQAHWVRELAQAAAVRGYLDMDELQAVDEVAGKIARRPARRPVSAAETLDAILVWIEDRETHYQTDGWMDADPPAPPESVAATLDAIQARRRVLTAVA